MKAKFYISMFVIMLSGLQLFADPVGIWEKFEKEFTCDVTYKNPLYEVKKFNVRFISPSGRIKNINGFWDGGKSWKVRFCPDEIGEWSFVTECSDEKNTGLHGQKGVFECIPNKSELEIYKRGVIVRPKGEYYLTYSDGKPFFWTA